MAALRSAVWRKAIREQRLNRPVQIRFSRLFLSRLTGARKAMIVLSLSGTMNPAHFPY